MAPATAENAPKLDLHGRTQDHQKADKWFREEYSRITAKHGSLSMLPEKRFGYAAKGAFIKIRRVKSGTEESVDEQVNLIPALYNLSEVLQIATKLGKEKAAADQISKAIYDGARLMSAVCVASESEGSLGQKTTVAVAPIPEGYVSAQNIEHPILGAVVLFDKDEPTYGSIASKEEYLRWLPALQSSWQAHNMWCIDLPTKEVADMADQVPALLESINKQIANLHTVSVYSILPVWLRYYSDGDMGTQRSGAYGIRNAELPRGGMRPLLYDAPAWKVGLRIGGKMIPGRVFMTPEGRFIASDWCQREADKNGGIDLHTGQYTKHTLMTWCAGPGISRFGNATTKAHHGELRRAVINQATITNAKQTAARAKLMKMLVTVKGKSTLRDGAMVVPEATQVASLRFVKFAPDDLTIFPGLSYDEDSDDVVLAVGFVARFGKYTHRVFVPLGQHETIQPASTYWDRYAGPISVPDCDSSYCAYEITDKELAQEIVNTMKECF